MRLKDVDRIRIHSQAVDPPLSRCLRLVSYASVDVQTTALCVEAVDYVDIQSTYQFNE